MAFVTLNDVTLHYRYRAGSGTPVVFLNSLGTDFRIWDAVSDLIGEGTPILCLDKRGHGLSDDGPITMDLLISDVAALIGHLNLEPAVVCGVSVGGLIAQGVASSYPQLVAGLVLCCTGAKIGDAASWDARISTVTQNGISGMADSILERWFSSGFRAENPASVAGYRNMLTRTPQNGYAGVCAAIRDTDYTVPTAQITCLTHCIAGSEDQATPPDVVFALSQLIDGSHYQSITGCGHLPCIEAPDVVADAISNMQKRLR